MQRKPKVTQGIVNDTCQELLESGKNITVNAVINAVAGSVEEPPKTIILRIIN